jgi:hypothetical protein
VGTAPVDLLATGTPVEILEIFLCKGQQLLLHKTFVYWFQGVIAAQAALEKRDLGA